MPLPEAFLSYRPIVIPFLRMTAFSKEGAVSNYVNFFSGFCRFFLDIPLLGR